MLVLRNYEFLGTSAPGKDPYEMKLTFDLGLIIAFLNEYLGYPTIRDPTTSFPSGILNIWRSFFIESMGGPINPMTVAPSPNEWAANMA